MDYEWDPDKAEVNFRKHEIWLADAVSVFADGYALTIEDEAIGERRFVTIGYDAFSRLLTVVYTYRAENIRLISARKATAGERRQYEE